MQKSVFFVLLISLFFFNCSNEIEKTEVSITYELLDDVSPITAIITTDMDVTWSE